MNRSQIKMLQLKEINNILLKELSVEKYTNLCVNMQNTINSVAKSINENQKPENKIDLQTMGEIND